MPHSVEMKAKLYIVVLEDYGNNLVQAKDNNANRINEIAFILWDIITSCESKHIWQMANETWVDDFGLVSIWLALHEQEELDSGLALIKDWRMNQECISEEMSSKGEMTKETMYNRYKMFSTLVCLYG